MCRPPRAHAGRLVVARPTHRVCLADGGTAAQAAEDPPLNAEAGFAIY